MSIFDKNNTSYIGLMTLKFVSFHRVMKYLIFNYIVETNSNKTFTVRATYQKQKSCV